MQKSKHTDKPVPETHSLCISQAIRSAGLQALVRPVGENLIEKQACLAWNKKDSAFGRENPNTHVRRGSAE